MKIITLVLAMLLWSVNDLGAQETLRDSLSGENCPAAGFMGIMPGITSKTELEHILNAANIGFDAAPIGALGNTTSYLFNPNSSSPFIANESDAVAIDVAVETVAEIAITLTGVTVADVVNWHGAPEVMGNMGSNALVYSNEGLVFVVSQDDQNTILFVILRSPGSEGGIRVFMDIQPCVGTGAVCNVPTATPAALPIADDAATGWAWLRELLRYFCRNM